jgi:hypothetical protein
VEHIADRSTGYAENTGGARSECKVTSNINHYECYPILLNSEIEETEDSFSNGAWPELVGKYLFDDPSWSLNLSPNEKRFIKMQAPNFKFFQNKLHRKVLYNDQYILVPYLADSHRKDEILKYHIVLGHLAKDSVFGVLRSRFWWPKMEGYIAEVIANCQKCDLYRQDSHKPLAPLHPLPPSPLPFQRWHIDYLQDLPESMEGYKNCFTAMDSATRWFIAVPTKNRTALTTAQLIFKEIVCNFGCPIELVSDRATAFLSEVLQEYLKILRTKHLPSSPWHPRTNGLVERSHSTFKRMMTNVCSGYPQRWPSFVPQVLLAMRSRIHSTTGYSPFYLLYGLNPILPGDHLPIDINDFSNLEDPVEYTARELEALGQARGAACYRTIEQAKRMKARYDSNERVRQYTPFEVGTYVRKRNHDESKYQYPWQGPFIVLEVLQNDTYRLMLPNGRMLETPIHHDELSIYKSTETERYITNTDNTLEDEERREEV